MVCRTENKISIPCHGLQGCVCPGSFQFSLLVTRRLALCTPQTHWLSYISSNMQNYHSWPLHVLFSFAWSAFSFFMSQFKCHFLSLRGLFWPCPCWVCHSYPCCLHPIRVSESTLFFDSVAFIVIYNDLLVYCKTIYIRNLDYRNHVCLHCCIWYVVGA